jgi:Methyltransferase FkbM domain
MMKARLLRCDAAEHVRASRRSLEKRFIIFVLVSSFTQLGPFATTGSGGIHLWTAPATQRLFVLLTPFIVAFKVFRTFETARTMVSLKSKGRSSRYSRFTRTVALPCALLFITTLNIRNNSTFDISKVSLRSLLIPSFDYHENAQRVKQWRQSLLSQCQAATSEQDMTMFSHNQTTGFTIPDSISALELHHLGFMAVRPCRHVVMDFGANIGDTSGHLIDAGMANCDRQSDTFNVATPYPHFNVETKQFELVKSRNKLTENLKRLLKEKGSDLGPEDYCYYGIEGNPHFTERLQGIENFVMSLDPRPVQHMHFFTESVGVGKDGMTKLYLDTVNEKQNFWGSSIFKDHQDVRKSADGKDVEQVTVPVMGYTIGKLMRMTLKAFDPKASAADKIGSHLLLKVDIEGGEYPLLHQAVEDGTLCEFVKMGNTADLFIEFHSAKVTGKHDYVGKTRGMKDALTACGVTFRNLAANWA